MSLAYVIPLLPMPALPVAGGKAFPVRRIWCVARNYAAHAREMGDNPAPCFFTKPADAVMREGEAIPYPPATADVHHEVELVVAIGRGGRDIPAADALGHVFGYAVGLDLTRRDLQTAARQAGLPWDMAKGFDHAAPCGLLQPAACIGHPAQGVIGLTVNGRVRQKGDLADMIWPVAEILAGLSRLVTLAPGDLVFTGTPEGVGPVVCRGTGCRRSSRVWAALTS
ncbi:MAG: putative fumarylacetoacetate hydrolase [Rhodospirillaceae bacterium]|nr:MAG: putative fumarylacetoacetate hydrolase [Rhodospirillaceae bacterium]